MILFIMNNNSPDNNHDNSTNEIMRIFFLDTKASKITSAREPKERIVSQVIDFFKQL